MKLITATIAGLLLWQTAGAQTTPKAGSTKVRKSAVAGYITDLRGEPMPKVQAFIYLGDSATNSSGYTDSKGYFETNNVLPGTYSLRLFFPANGRRITINDVPVKKLQLTQFRLKTEVPAADSSIAWGDVAPAAPAKK